jgi:hypothetical protein
VLTGLSNCQVRYISSVALDTSPSSTARIMAGMETETRGGLGCSSFENQTSSTPLLHGRASYGAEVQLTARRINLKMDLGLLPLLSLLYLSNGLDRGNVGNAQTQGRWSVWPMHWTATVGSWSNRVGN